MSPRTAQERLRDILSAIDQIADHRRRGSERDFAPDDQLLIDALVRQLAIIGEAAAHLPAEILERHPTVPWTDIKGMRLHLDHGYHRVSADIVLNTVQDELGVVRDAVVAELEDS